MNEILPVPDAATAQRKLLPTEAVAIGLPIYEEHQRKVAEHQRKHAFDGGKQRLGSARDVAGCAVGMSAVSFDRARLVVIAARSDPQRFGDLLSLMDTTTIWSAFKELQRRERVGAGASKARHAVHRRKQYLNHGRVMERVVSAISGICMALERVNPEHLDETKKEAWCQALYSDALKIVRLVKSITKGVGENHG